MPEIQSIEMTRADEAIDLARDLRDRIVVGAADRDRERILLFEQFDLIKESGLLALPVPVWRGGAGLSVAALIAVLVEINRADPNVGQILVNHFTGCSLPLAARREELADTASATWERQVAAAVDGRLCAGAHAERGGKHGLDLKTRLTGPTDGVYRLDGTKYYSTGSLYADELMISALDDQGALAFVQIPADSPGVQLVDDWDGFGQRLTASGTTILTEVPVAPDQVVRQAAAARDENEIFGDQVEGALIAAACAAYHTTVSIGIARAAFEDGRQFLQERARPWVYAGVESAVEEPFLLKLEGELATRLHAAEGLLTAAGEALERAYATLADADVLAARVAVGEAKAFASEAGLRIASDLFTLGGTQATLATFNLDRHWRNLRTHETHDATRWLYFHVGNANVNGASPPLTGKL